MELSFHGNVWYAGSMNKHSIGKPVSIVTKQDLMDWVLGVG